MSIAAPSFTDLPGLSDCEERDRDERHSWGVFGKDDELGTVNFITPEVVRNAAALVRDGAVISLCAPLNEPSPGLFESRSAFRHTIRKTSHGRDDRLDGFYPQFSSQWDGLRHVRYHKYGFYNGRQDVDVDEGGRLGVEHWAARGIVTRGVLIDAKRYFDDRGQRFAPNERRPINRDDLDAICAAQKVAVRPGDVVMLRTGWFEWYRSLDRSEREAMRGSIGRAGDPLGCPGLDAHRETVAWLWDHQVAGIAADNAALESLPVSRDAGFLHYRLIPLLGMAIGEFWWLGDVSRHCAKAGRYEFLLTSGVMNVPGGCGSPTNAYAVF